MKLKTLSLLNLIVVLVFICVLALSTYLKVFPVLNNNFPFTMDQARDMLDIRHIVELRKPTLIGPTTSINGVFLGPFYYYFNVIPYIASGGNPAALTYWNIAWYMIAGISIFLYFYRKDKVLGTLSSTIFLMAPSLFYSSRYFWSANPMPYMTTFYLLSIINFLRNITVINALIVGLISGLSMQVEAAFGVLFLPFFIIFSVLNRTKIKYVLASIGAFFITLLPQIFFEFRHDFIMTKTFFGEVSGTSQILGERLSTQDTFISHLTSFIDFSSGQFEIPAILSGIFLAISICYLGFLTFTKKLEEENRRIFFISIFFVLYAFAFYMFYSYPLKGWYLLGLRIPYILITALFLSEIFKIKFPVFKIIVVLFLGWSFYATYIDQSRFILRDISDRSLDKSNLRNEIEAIDWVYTKADGRGFKAYNYIPSVYDFPYQYLFWWYGGNRYGYHPELVTYQEGVPEYIINNEKFYTLKKPSDNSFIFLIYEPDENQDRLAAWLGNFTKFCTKDRKIYIWGTTVEYREPCPN